MNANENSETNRITIEYLDMINMRISALESEVEDITRERDVNFSLSDGPIARVVRGNMLTLRFVGPKYPKVKSTDHVSMRCYVLDTLDDHLREARRYFPDEWKPVVDFVQSLVDKGCKASVLNFGDIPNDIKPRNVDELFYKGEQLVVILEAIYLRSRHDFVVKGNTADLEIKLPRDFDVFDLFYVAGDVVSSLWPSNDESIEIEISISRYKKEADELNESMENSEFSEWNETSALIVGGWSYKTAWGVLRENNVRSPTARIYIAYMHNIEIPPSSNN